MSTAVGKVEASRYAAPRPGLIYAISMTINATKGTRSIHRIGDCNRRRVDGSYTNVSKKSDTVRIECLILGKPFSVRGEECRK